MKVSKLQSEANRRAVVEAAGRLFRARGLDGVALPELMRAAGLTHGGFYKKFGSRDDLVREATRDALGASRQRATNRVATATAEPLAALVRGYLSTEHRESPATGCCFATLAPEVARSEDPELKAIVADELDRYLDLIEGVLGPEPEARTRDAAILVLSTMVGAMVLSRIAGDPAEGERMLGVATRALLDRAPK